MAYSDDIAGAPDITSGGGGWDNLTATHDGSEPSMIGGSQYTVWQKVFITAAGTYAFSHDTSVPGDTVMSIYQGPAAATYADLVNVGSGDDEAGSSKPRIVYTSPGSEWIYVQSAGFGTDRVSGQTTIFGLAPTIPAGWFDSSGWSALVGDCGPYIGDWPPYPPLPATFALEPDSSEIDYFIAIPNPSGDPAAVADGSYDTPWIDLWRSGSAPADWTSAHGASGSAIDDPSAAPAGAHLFVFWYAGAGTAPAHTPLDLAPSNMAAGGTAPLGGFASGGSWSGWQDEDPFTSDATAATTRYSVRSNARTGGDPAVPPAGDAYTPNLLPDPLAVIRGQYAAAVAGTSYDSSDYTASSAATGGVYGSTPPAAAVYTQLDIDANFSTVGGNHYYTDVEMFSQVYATAFDLTPPTGRVPPGFADLTPGIDYAITVDQLTGGTNWERDPLGAASWGWVSWEPTIVAKSHSSSQPPPTSYDGNDGAQIVLVSDTTDPTLWDMGSSGGVLWQQLGLTATDTTFTPTIDLSSLPASPFIVAGRLTSQATPTDLFMVPTGDPHAGGIDLSEAISQFNAAGVPQALVQLPQWRYWALGVKWHTVGGHWATVGGGTLQILTPLPGGSVWVDVVDGPA